MVLHFSKNIIYNYLKVGIAPLFLVLHFNFAHAQVNSPDMLCVRSDSIFFNPIQINCGPHLGYILHYSTQIDGPYTILDTILDPLSYFYLHPNNSEFYYYIESYVDCPGISVIPSDTITNIELEELEINLLTVQGDKIFIDWQESTNPNVESYIVYRTGIDGTRPLDTVINSQYLDSTASLDQEWEYYILSLDQCGGTSIFPRYHNNLILDTIEDPCLTNQSFLLNLYNGWELDEQIIYLYQKSLNGPDILLDSFAPNTQIQTENIISGLSNCFYAIAQNRVNGLRSMSSEICFTPRIHSSVDFLRLNDACLQDNGIVDLSWTTNADASIESLFLVRDQVDTINLPLFGNQNVNFFSTPFIDNDSVSYQILVLDSCGTQTQSNVFVLPQLQGDISINNVISLTVTGPTLPMGAHIKSSKLIQKITNRSPTYVITLDNIFNQKITLDANDFEDETICFQTIYQYTLDGNPLIFSTKSPVRCVDKFPALFIPNAFSPNGINDNFKPKTASTEISGYQLQIFNRYGQELFRTTNISEGWDGLHNGKVMPKGNYMYVIQIQDSSGRSINFNGNLILLD